MTLEKRDMCLSMQLESGETAQKIEKQSKISYTRDFLLSLSELDICKKLPRGFDSSNLHEFDDGNRTTTSDYYSGICGKWELRDCSSSGLSDRDCHSLYEAEAGRHYSIQCRHSRQNSEHDGLLGSGAFLKTSGTSGALAPKARGSGYQQLNRCAEPYRPPRCYKVMSSSGRDCKDSFNDETFGSAECLSQERAEEEMRRRASFELMRKEPHKTIQEKQKQIADEYKENFDPDTVTMEDKRDGKGLLNKDNELEDSAALVASSNDFAKSSYSMQTPASRPPVPPGFASRILEKNLGANSSHCSLGREHSDSELDNLPCPGLISSKFALWFPEGEENLVNGISSGKEFGGSEVCGMSNGRVTGHCPTNFSARKEFVHELNTSTSTSTIDGMCGDNKSIGTPQVLTCKDLEQSILSEVIGISSIEHLSVHDGGVCDLEDLRLNSQNDDTASQHLLSLLQKGVNLKHLAASSEPNLGPSNNCQPFEVEGDTETPEISSKVGAGNSEKNLILEPFSGAGFIEGLQSVEATVSCQKDSTGWVTRNNVSDSQIDLNLRDDQGMKPVAGFDEKAHLKPEVCLPEEDSFVTVDDPIIPQCSMFASSRNSVKGMEGPPLLHSSYVTGLQTSHHNFPALQSFPQFQTNMNPGRAFFRPLQCHEAHMSSQINSMDPEPLFQNPSPLHRQFSEDVPFLPSLNTHGELAEFDRHVNQSLLQKRHLPVNFPSHQLIGLPRGAMFHDPANQTACYTEDPNPLQSFLFNRLQPSYEAFGMPNQDPGDVGGNRNPVAIERLIEMELRAKQRHPLAAAVIGQGAHNPRVSGHWYENRSRW